MANPSKRKGSSFEREVADYLREHGHPKAERTYIIGLAADKGDICGVEGYAIQCKNRNGIDLASALDEAQAQAVNADAPNAVAVIKRRMRSTGQAYVVMTLEQFARLTARLDS